MIPRNRLFLTLQPASDCEASNYSLEIIDASSNTLVQSVNLTSDGTNSVRGNLSENEVYVFRIFVSNVIGTVPTSNITLCEYKIESLGYYTSAYC